MQGYILDTRHVRDEDLIVSVLTQAQVKTLYRFYGTRHSIVHVGYKIDFEVEISQDNFMARIRSPLHLAFPWIYEKEKLFVWQQFIRLFYPHLRGVEELDTFYFELLDDAALRFEHQNPKRVAVESYVKLLAYEGRLHGLEHCFFCETAIEVDEPLAFGRAFLPAHQKCILGDELSKEGVWELFEKGNTLFLDDVSVEILWKLMLEGL